MSLQGETKLNQYFAAWVGSLASLLSRLTSGSWQEEPAAAEGSPSLACVRITAAGGLPGQQSLYFSAAGVAELLSIFLSEEVSLPSELDPTQGEALEELVRQWSGLAASALKPNFGEVTLEAALDPSGCASGQGGRWLRVSDGTRAIAAQIEWDEVLAGALAEPAAAVPTQAAPATVPAAIPAASDRVEELLRQGNLELLMDVELGVILRFGSRQTTLHEVLDLTTGAVLELDREIQEPVDLMLNGRIIARGEVVVVDGNYGLRVTEVASPQQRVNSL
ncbi:MAG: flagellar motor switch protein FliN [Candidatus Korobacteraceae bacterium]